MDQAQCDQLSADLQEKQQEVVELQAKLKGPPVLTGAQAQKVRADIRKVNGSIAAIRVKMQQLGCGQSEPRLARLMLGWNVSPCFSDDPQSPFQRPVLRGAINTAISAFTASNAWAVPVLGKPVVDSDCVISRERGGVFTGGDKAQIHASLSEIRLAELFDNPALAIQITPHALKVLVDALFASWRGEDGKIRPPDIPQHVTIEKWDASIAGDGIHLNVECNAAGYPVFIYLWDELQLDPDEDTVKDDANQITVISHKRMDATAIAVALTHIADPAIVLLLNAILAGKLVADIPTLGSFLKLLFLKKLYIPGQPPMKLLFRYLSKRLDGSLGIVIGGNILATVRKPKLQLGWRQDKPSGKPVLGSVIYEAETDDMNFPQFRWRVTGSKLKLKKLADPVSDMNGLIWRSTATMTVSRRPPTGVSEVTVTATDADGLKISASDTFAIEPV